MVDLINTKTFFPDTNKQKQKRNNNKKSDKETVGAIIEVDKESSPTDSVHVELETIDSEESESRKPSNEESDISCKLEASSEAPNAQSAMENVLALI